MKVDLLGLGMMAVLQDALAIVNANTHVDMNTHANRSRPPENPRAAERREAVLDDVVDRWCPATGLDLARPTIRRCIACCRRRTPSASSRSSRARRWRRCRG